MYYIDPNTLPLNKVEIPRYDAIRMQEHYFILTPKEGDVEFNPNDLNSSEKSLAENYVPPITALIAVKGSDMFTAFELNKGTMHAIIDGKKYLVTLMADNFTSSSSKYYPAGLAEI